MRHCNSVFQAYDIWFLLDNKDEIKRKLYIANCPICGKKIAQYFSVKQITNEINEKYYYSGGADKIKQKIKKEIKFTMLGFKNKYKMPYGFIFGENKEIRKNGKLIGSKQYACDFYGNRVHVKKVIDEQEKRTPIK